jgi:hypothetical protein
MGPPGSGKTAIASAAVEEVHRRGFEVLRASPANGKRGRWVWAQLLHDFGDPDRLVRGEWRELGTSDGAVAAVEVPKSS